jgi:hypothetical protein
MVEEKRLTRRQVLKYGGIGTAALATPLVYSSTAAAANRNQTICATRSARDDVAACATCNNLPSCDPGGNCFCFVTTVGCCFCVSPRSCSAAEPCRKNKDCPMGFKCVHSCCDNAGFGPLCGKPCGDPGGIASLAELRGQMTQAGQF